MSILKRVVAPKMEKLATRFTLPGQPGSEVPELLNLLLQQHSFLSEFSVSTQMHGSDPQAGYFYGIFIIRPHTPPEVPITKDTPSVRVPFMVQNKRVYPFDVFITKDGSFFPLTQTRVTTALLRSSPYSPASSSKVRGIQGIEGSFMPDVGQSGDSEMGRYTSAKLGSVLLAEAVSAVPHKVRDTFLAEYVADPLVKAAARASVAVPAALEKIASVPYFARTRQAKEAESFDVAVVAYDSRGFRVKLANAGGLEDTKELPLSRLDAEGIPVDVRHAAMERGFAALVGYSKEKLASPAFSDAEVLNKLAAADVHGGMYTLRADDGTYGPAAVFTKIAYLSGQRGSRVLVVGDRGMSLQEPPVGMPARSTVPVVGRSLDKLAEKNVFIIGDTVTEPLRYLGTNYRSDGDELRVETEMGARYTLKLANVQNMLPAGSGVILVPGDIACWPYDQAKCSYTSNASLMSKVAKLSEIDDTVTLEYAHPGALIHREGSPVEKIASDADVLLWLLSMGDTVEGATEKLAGMCSKPGKKLQILSKGKKRKGKEETAAEEEEEEVKEASACRFCTDGAPCVVHANLSKEELRAAVAAVQTNLSKEAAIVAAPDTIDAVLSLGFVNEQNIAMFLEHLPTLEKAVSSLAEMLLGVRLGIQDIPEPSLSTALTGVEKAIQGLKKLNIRLSLPEATAE